MLEKILVIIPPVLPYPSPPFVLLCFPRLPEFSNHNFPHNSRHDTDQMPSSEKRSRQLRCFHRRQRCFSFFDLLELCVSGNSLEGTMTEICHEPP